MITFQVHFHLQCVLFSCLEDYKMLIAIYPSSFLFLHRCRHRHLLCDAAIKAILTPTTTTVHLEKFLRLKLCIMLLIRLIDFLRLQFLPPFSRVVVGGKNLHANFYLPPYTHKMGALEIHKEIILLLIPTS